MTGTEVYSWIPGEPVEGATIGVDRNTHHPGERSKLSLGVASPNPDGRVTITDQNGTVVRDLGIQSGTSHPTFRMPSPGNYQVRENGTVIDTFEVEPRTQPEPDGQFNERAFNRSDDNMALGISPDDNLTGGGSISATGLMSDNDNSSSTGLSTTVIAVVIGVIVLVVGMGDM